MIRIRPEQMAALQRAELDRFVRERLPLFRRTWPSRCSGVTDDALFADLRAALDCAVREGLRSGDGLVAFLHLRMKLGFRFPDAPPFAWAREILRDPVLADREKLARLIAGANARD
jgi:hypothetical protein